MGDDSTTLPTLDERLEAVAHVERRRLLLALLEGDRRDEPVVDVRVTDPDVYESELLVAMQHVHLPALAEPGFVDWDPEIDRVRRGPNFEALEPFLRPIREHYDEIPDEWP